MPITVANPFKGRQHPGEVILQAVRWYLRFPLVYEHAAELLAERGLAVDASCRTVVPVRPPVVLLVLWSEWGCRNMRLAL